MKAPRRSPVPGAIPGREDRGVVAAPTKRPVPGAIPGRENRDGDAAPTGKPSISRQEARPRADWEDVHVEGGALDEPRDELALLWVGLQSDNRCVGLKPDPQIPNGAPQPDGSVTPFVLPGYCTSIRRRGAGATFGNTSSSRPSLKVAFAASQSTPAGSDSVRVNAPREISQQWKSPFSSRFS